MSRSGQDVVDYIEYVEWSIYDRLWDLSDPACEDYLPLSPASIQRGVNVLYRDQIDVRTGFTGLEKLALLWDSGVVTSPRDEQIIDFSKFRLQRGFLGHPKPTRAGIT